MKSQEVNCQKSQKLLASRAGSSKQTIARTVFNPILTGLFESKFLLGGGGQFDPPFRSRPQRGPIAAKILHGCQDTCKEYCYKKKLAENGLFIILL